jgi:large subunit ribosomal protein L13
MKPFKTFAQKPAEISRQWVVIDASTAPLGRVATTIAKYLIGKKKPTYTAHVDNGDYVIVINAGKLVVTGNKMEDKMYYRHTGYPGGIRQRTLTEQMNIDPTFVITEAVRGMLPKNKLVDGRLARLKVYAGSDHTHAPQNPVTVEVEK